MCTIFPTLWLVKLKWDLSSVKKKDITKSDMQLFVYYSNIHSYAGKKEYIYHPDQIHDLQVNWQ